VSGLIGFAEVQHWPLKVPFVIARSRRDSVEVLYVSLSDGRYTGRGEGQPNPRYSQDAAADCARLRAWFAEDRDHAADLLAEQWPAGVSSAAINALDAAWVDLQAQRRGVTVADLLGLERPVSVTSAFTLSLDSPNAMASAAQEAGTRGIRFLKLKLGGGDDRDAERMRAVRSAVPEAHLVADANEGWTPDTCASLLDCAHDQGFSMIEQPLPAENDIWLQSINHPLPICADESFQRGVNFADLSARYDMVNVKLDKFCGIRACVSLVRKLKKADMPYMLGCMLGTSLAIRPAMLIAGGAALVDLDAPFLLAQDREASLVGQSPMQILAP